MYLSKWNSEEGCDSLCPEFTCIADTSGICFVNNWDQKKGKKGFDSNSCVCK